MQARINEKTKHVAGDYKELEIILSGMKEVMFLLSVYFFFFGSFLLKNNLLSMLSRCGLLDIKFNL